MEKLRVQEGMLGRRVGVWRERNVAVDQLSKDCLWHETLNTYLWKCSSLINTPTRIDSFTPYSFLRFRPSPNLLLWYFHSTSDTLTGMDLLPLSILFLLSMLSPVSLESNDDDLLMTNKLRLQLLRVQRYNKNARPVIRHTTVTNVSFTMYIRRFIELDHKTSSLKTYATIYAVIN